MYIEKGWRVRYLQQQRRVGGIMTGYESVVWLVEPSEVAIDLLPVRSLDGCDGLLGQAVI